MSALGAFLRGAAGAGLTDLVQQSRRQEELAMQMAQREKEREEERRFREEQARLDREGRMELLQQRQAGGGGSSSSGGGGGGALNDARGMAVSGLMREKGLSLGEADRLYSSSERGVNPLTKPGTRMEEDAGGNTYTPDEFDVERWAEINRIIGANIQRAGGNPDQRAKARQTDVETSLLQEATAPGVKPERQGQIGRGVASATAKPVFNEGDNLFTGEVGEKAKAETKAAGALAAQRGAETTKARAEVDKLKADTAGDLKKQTPEKLTTTLNAINGLIRTYDENSMDEGAKAARAELQTMAREIAAELRSRGMGQGGGAPTAAGDKPKAPPPDVLQKARDAIKRGAKRDDVAARLKAAGYDPAGL